MFDSIYDAIHREMDGIAEKYSNGVQLTEKDLDMVDRMAHALKCLATYEAMTTRGRGRYTDRGWGGYDRRY